MTEMWEFREKMLALAAQVGQGTGERDSVTIERARCFANFVFSGGWKRVGDKWNSTGVMFPWQQPMEVE